MKRTQIYLEPQQQDFLKNLAFPGIVAGRYQHLTQNHKLFNDLKTKFTWEK
jgi:hypothetical protein